MSGTNPFKPATKREAKLRLALSGPSGSGKTYSALRIATALAPKGKVAVIDTEHGSASKYADLFAFDVVELSHFSPDDYIRAIKAAEQFGYDVLIIDSLSHAWAGTGGVLEIVDNETKRQKGNSYAAWQEGTKQQNKLVDAIMGSRLHVIATLRAKQEYVIEKDEKGKTVIRKVGLAPVQRDGLEYEFDVFGEMDTGHNLVVSKSRCPALADGVFAYPGEDVAEALRTWLEGTPASEAPAQWTYDPIMIRRAEKWLYEEMALSDADANAALGMDDWRHTSLDRDAFKATINAYIAQKLEASEPPSRAASASGVPQASNADTRKAQKPESAKNAADGAQPVLFPLPKSRQPSPSVAAIGR